MKEVYVLPTSSLQLAACATEHCPLERAFQRIYGCQWCARHMRYSVCVIARVTLELFLYPCISWSEFYIVVFSCSIASVGMLPLDICTVYTRSHLYSPVCTHSFALVNRTYCVKYLKCCLFHESSALIMQAKRWQCANCFLFTVDGEKNCETFILQDGQSEWERERESRCKCS